MLPDHPHPLISHGEDGRRFRRFVARRDAGVRALGPAILQSGAAIDPRAGTCFHSAVVRDLSMTGLYLVSRMPYRVGLGLEVEIPLPTGLITVTGVVHRAGNVTRHDGNGPAGGYGCGVHFLQSQMCPDVRRTLMRFLLQLAPNELNTLPSHRLTQAPPHPTHCNA